MTAAEIRQRFLDFFAEHGHRVRPSASLVPSDDPTLLFTNAGMVPFKRVFLGLDELDSKRAVTSQKCVRAGGKHNDLEEVGKTTRHHTFFEMLGNFSFGDYFKSEAVDFAWAFLVGELGLDPERLVVTVHHTDDEAEKLWIEQVGVDPARIFRLGDKDNFWQMADTGPCGPCSELHYDLRPEGERGRPVDRDRFIEMSEDGRFVELWNLVFMQFDRDAEGVMHPLPAPSIDTGAGLERLAAVLQGVDSNFHTDLFEPLLARVAEVVGRPYERETDAGVSYRVLADHARAVAFLLADGVFPSNEGRGYVLRRILRRAVRHAWLLGRREPTLVHVVESVIDAMGDTYPELRQRREHLLTTTRAEEERFLSTIEGGLDRFEELAPAGGTGTIPGDEAFRLYDTFGFPLDLTELMAEERGWTVDAKGFARALEAQRARSRADRAASGVVVEGGETFEGWSGSEHATQSFVGYAGVEARSPVLAWRRDGDRVGLILRDNPFYLESGGQVSDRGSVVGDGWTVTVDDVRSIEGRSAVFGTIEGDWGEAPGEVEARVGRELRHDTERNHTATHLLHAALRGVLGEHVVQRGSLVAPDRLRFDFAHTAPMTVEERAEVERRVNAGIWADHPVVIDEMAHADAVAQGAMALFGEKYGDRVRVVRIPEVSMELCGGTHVRHTGEIGLFKLVSESGVAAGVRRVEAQTGPGAFRYLADIEARLDEAARTLKTQPDNVVHRAEQILQERAELESLLDDLRKGGGGGETVVAEVALETDGTPFQLSVVRMRARDADDARRWGDAFLESVDRGVAVVAADLPGDKHSLFTFVSDDLIARGIRADAVVREVAAVAGGRGGGRPHLAQAGVGDPGRVDEALAAAEGVVRALAEAG
ncbi:alanine--tRNA ligase [Gaopeijia maritima]|uniref:alanine--tRNA ligase n=1 Tax=Gaopeijia maritima TaxID=3119007 RepID=UPI00324F7534